MMEQSIVFEVLRGCLFALPLAAGFFLLLRIKAPCGYFLALGILPVCLPLWLVSNLRVYGYHGLMQAGIVYEILNGHLPPHNPLFAGQPLLYPWGYAFWVALLSRMLHISPFYSTALLSTVALAGILIATFYISRLFTDDLAANLFATLIPLYAFTFTQNLDFMPLWHSNAAHLAGFGEWRSMPIVEKFNGDTGFPFGFFLYGAFFYLFLRSITAESWNWRQAGLLVLLLIGVGFTYPFFLPALDIGGFAACMVIAFRNRQGNWRQPVMVAVALVAGSVVLLLYLLPITHGKFPAGKLVPNLSWPHWKRKIGVLLLTCAPIWLLLCLYRRRLWDILKEHRPATVGLVLSVAVSYLLFLAVNTPFASEYKFLSQGMYLTGILGGWCFSFLRRRRPLLSFALVALFLVPMGMDVAMKSTNWLNAGVYPRGYSERGLDILSKNPVEEAFYTWVQKKTDTDAVFLDASLDMTIYGRRELYVGVPTIAPFAGFGMTSQEMLGEDNGYNPALIQQRMKTLDAVLDGKNPLTLADLAPVRQHFPDNEIFIIGRTGKERRRLARCPFLKKAFSDGAIAAFSIAGVSARPLPNAVARRVGR